ncbi:major facilitator superfamily protein [Striga asiatica]|uniref:Major facilitator superfamily protein n=1 Tax=Striga asiatica TaxID=4170 RepID=A0A5A7P310_STRAF|nr:major facilitator superfamily protein [Striga asiatica]
MGGEMEIGSRSPANVESQNLSPSQSSKPKKVGGWRAIAYILGNESFEKLASMSLVANITVYLRTKYNLSGILLVNVVTIWFGTANISSILGAVVSDAFIGRFLTLLIGTLFSLTGMAAMTLTAAAPSLRPPPCSDDDQPSCRGPHEWQLAFLFISLGLIALGAGGIRPCNIAFGADQFDTNTAHGRARLESFFNWWYLSFTGALIIALTAVVYVQTEVSWVAGFAIPTACLLTSVTIFLLGRHVYVYKVPRGSVFIDVAKVAVAAFKKRKLEMKVTSSAGDLRFHDPPGEDDNDEWEERKKSRVERFRFFDRAAVIEDGDEVGPAGTWRLCTLEQVENLKCLLGVVPVWVSGVGCFLVMDQQSTFGILQSIQMDRSLGGGSFEVPPGWMGISSMIALSIWILIYEWMYIPVAKRSRCKRVDPRISMRARIGIGIAMSVACMAIAGCVERRRRSLALRRGSFVSSLHVSTLLPQFALSGLTEAFAAVALMEFFTRRMPESMRSVAGAIFFLSLSAASYMSSLIVNVMHSVTGGKGRVGWLGGHDLNLNKLDNYYFIIAALGVVNFAYFYLFASKYVPCGEHGESEVEDFSEEITPVK